MFEFLSSGKVQIHSGKSWDYLERNCHQGFFNKPQGNTEKVFLLGEGGYLVSLIGISMGFRVSFGIPLGIRSSRFISPLRLSSGVEFLIILMLAASSGAMEI